MLGGLRNLIGQDGSSKNDNDGASKPFNTLRSRAVQTINNFSHSIPGVGSKDKSEQEGPRDPAIRSAYESPPRSNSLQIGSTDPAKVTDNGPDILPPLSRRRSRSFPEEPRQHSLRTRAMQIKDTAFNDLRANLPRLPSFQFSLPFSDPESAPQTRSDALDNIRDFADSDNMSITSLELESRRTDGKVENNRMRGLIEGLPKLSLPTGTSVAPFAGLSAETKDLNIIVLGGYRGSILRSTEDGKMLWIPVKVGLGLRKVDLELSLDESAEEHAVDRIYPDGMLTNIGPVDISRRLLRRLKEQEARGYCKVATFGYDWRLGGEFLSNQLITFLDKLNGPSLLIAHSLGGLITLHAMNKRPELFAGVLFAGTPFAGCPNILGPFRYGDGVLINKSILNPRTNFSMRSSFVLLPTHKRCFVDIESGKEILVDLFDPGNWLKYGFSPEVAADHGLGDRGESTDLNGRIAGGGVGGPVFGREINDNKASLGEDGAESSDHLHRSPKDVAAIEKGETSALGDRQQKSLEYLKRTLAATLKFRSELAFNATVSYPPLAILRSRTTPTVRGCSVFGEQGIKNGDYSKFIFSQGDGVVTYAAADIRQSDPHEEDEKSNSKWQKYLVEDVENDRGHIGLLGDTAGVEKCLQAILSSWRKSQPAVRV